MVTLVFTEGSLAGKRHELKGTRTVVGRAPDNALVLADPSLSATHCEILVNGPEVIVRDLGSRNGTMLDGVKLQNGQAPARHGSMVRFGAVLARIEIQMPEREDSMTTEQSAVQAFRKEVARAGEKPAGVEPKGSVQFGDLGGTDAQKTITMPVSASNPATASPGSPRPATKTTSKSGPITIAVLVLAALALFLFLRR